MDFRLGILLKALNTATFEPLPHLVGLKTAIVARDAGLIDVEPGILLRPRCRLTPAGFNFRKAALERDNAD